MAEEELANDYVDPPSRYDAPPRRGPGRPRKVEPVPPPPPSPEMVITAERLQSMVSRIERLQEEQKALAGDVKDIFLEAKSSGYDVKVLRQIIKIRKMEPAEYQEQEALLDVYRRALNMD